jgi:outer membrane protein assembly factor BamB
MTLRSRTYAAAPSWLLASGSCLLLAAGLHAQFGRREAEWMTAGADAQRSHWIPADGKISRESLAKPGFQLLWKVKLPSQPVGLNSLTPAVLIDRYIGYRGFRSLALLGGAANSAFAVDTDLSRVEWEQQLPVAAAPAATAACPGGLTANVTRETSASYPPSEPVGGGLGGRSAPARTDVAPPGEGAVTIPAALSAIERARTAPPRQPPRVRLPAVVHLIASDGKLYSLYISNGMEAGPPLDFLPPDANAQGLIVLDRIAYAATGICGGTHGAVWSLDLESKQINHWDSPVGTIAGSAGPAFGPDGTVYATTSAGQLVALSSSTLQLMKTYSTGGPAFTSSPVVFPYKGKTLVAAATADGRIHLLEAQSLTGSESPIYSVQGFAPSALATWQDLDGVRWILAAAGSPNGAIAAWRVAEHNNAGGDATTLELGWRSADMLAPLTPAIINGVVFAVSGGDQSSPAVLYALDGVTGKKLWDNGRTITSFTKSGGITGEAGQVYLETYDGTLYAFGFPTEH